MPHSTGRFYFSVFQMFPWMMFVIVLCTGCSLFTDNSTQLAYQLESASKKFKSKKDLNEITIHYKSEDSKAPFTILVVPAKGVTSDELYQKGLDSMFVEKLFDLKKGGAIAVYQNGVISNTSYHRNFVEAVAPSIINGIGSTNILVKRVGVGPGHLTKEIVLIELHNYIKK